jgi:hypothetical protein
MFCIKIVPPEWGLGDRSRRTRWKSARSAGSSVSFDEGNRSGINYRSSAAILRERNVLKGTPVGQTAGRAGKGIPKKRKDCYNDKYYKITLIRWFTVRSELTQ